MKKLPFAVHHTQLTYVPTHQLRPSPWNPQATRYPKTALKESIAMVGVLSPLVVIQPQDQIIILDGHTRYTTAVELGIERLPCVFIEPIPTTPNNIPDDWQEQIWAHLNRTSKVIEGVQHIESFLLGEVVADYEDTIKEMAEVLGRRYLHNFVARNRGPRLYESAKNYLQWQNLTVGATNLKRYIEWTNIPGCSDKQIERLMTEYRDNPKDARWSWDKIKTNRPVYILNGED